MGVAPIWNLAISMMLMQSLMQMLNVNGPIEIHYNPKLANRKR